MEAWKKELLKFMDENGLNQVEMTKQINEAGGDINPAGFNHWINRKNSRPNSVNSVAIEKVLNHKIYFYSEPGEQQ